MLYGKQEPSHNRRSAVPFSQSDSGKLDQVSHAGSDNDRTLVWVTGLIVALHLLHYKLGMAQQCVLSEAVEVQSCRRHSCLRAEETEVDPGSHSFFISEMLHSQNIRCMGVTGLMLIKHPLLAAKCNFWEKDRLSKYSYCQILMLLVNSSHLLTSHESKVFILQKLSKLLTSY